MSLGGGKGSSSSKVKVPDFLRPLFRTGAGIAEDALGSLDQLLQPGRDLVASFSPQQEAAQIIGTQRALGAGGYFPTARDTVMSTAEGTPISEFLPQVSTLEQLATNGAIDPAVLERLQSSMGGEIPGMDTLSQIESGLNPISREALEATARGDFLYGGEGFNAALEAAKARIMPEVITQFGRTGAGGGTGSLAEEAIGRRLGETFASQYGAERGRQLGAAEALTGLEFQDRGQQADISSTLAQLGLAGTGRELDIARTLSDIGATDAGIRSGAATTLGEFGDRERNRQLGAAELLPSIATADINLLSGIGNEIQGQEQAEIDAPIDAQLRLLSAALGLDLNSLLGSKTNQRSAFFGLGG